MNKSTKWSKSLAIYASLLLLWLVARAGAADQAVVISDDSSTVTLSNGIVTATVRKMNANVESLRFHEVELLSGHGGGYWNVYGKIPGKGPSTEVKGTPSVFKVTQDPANNGGAIGEISLLFPFRAGTTAEPLDIEIRYTLRRGDSGLYGWTIVDHDPKYPPFNIEVSTLCLKLNPDIFDFLSIDEQKQRHMAAPEDWVKGTQLNLWEARRLNTGIRKGEVEHKYDYSMMFARTPAWGWSSTQRHIGLFIVNPSVEYIGGPAVSVDYGGHIDVKPDLPADPCLLFIWQSPHYGGRGIHIGADEHWRKVVGPFLFYCTSGESPQAMWKDSLTRAARETGEWPYSWADAPGYEHSAERGTVRGHLEIADPQAPTATSAGAWVGLAQPPYTTNDNKSGVTIDWQTDGKHYQYWTRANGAGDFVIPNARPGSYVLYAFTDGVLGEFCHPSVQVELGKTTELGRLAWTPIRHGRQLWEIGTPNRSAEEFRHGNEYWQWGLYNLYPQEFPRDVDFAIGKSDWRHDWNYVQPPHPDGKGGWTDTTWRIRFGIDRALEGVATLRLAICGSNGGPVDVSLNGQPIGSTGPLPASGVMHRDGIRAASLAERDIPFDAALLKQGENVITLTKRSRSWTEGVLYDYLRLEVEEKTK